jgi:hypothetical protein
VQSRCSDEALSNETAGQSARTLLPGSSCARAPLPPALRIARRPRPPMRAFTSRPTLRAAAAACVLLAAPNCCFTPS